MFVNLSLQFFRLHPYTYESRRCRHYIQSTTHNTLLANWLQLAVALLARTMQITRNFTTYFVLQRTFEFKTKENVNTKEDVGADVKENYVQYHRQDDDSEVTVIEDFNRVSKSDAFTHYTFLI